MLRMRSQTLFLPFFRDAVIYANESWQYLVRADKGISFEPILTSRCDSGTLRSRGSLLMTYNLHILTTLTSDRKAFR